MDADRLNRWMTLGANIAVLVGLIVLIVEIRTNTNSIRAAAIQETTTGTREALMTVASDAELARIVRTGEFNRADLDEEDAFRYWLFSRQRWIFFQGVWTQRQLGVLDDRAWQNYERVICVLRNNELGGGAEWPNHKSTLSDEFVAFVDSCAI